MRNESKEDIIIIKAEEQQKESKGKVGESGKVRSLLESTVRLKKEEAPEQLLYNITDHRTTMFSKGEFSTSSPLTWPSEFPRFPANTEIIPQPISESPSFFPRDLPQRHVSSSVSGKWLAPLSPSSPPPTNLPLPPSVERPVLPYTPCDGAVRCRTLSYWRSRGAQAPETAVVSAAKRLYVRQTPYIVTGRRLRSALDPVIDCRTSFSPPTASKTPSRECESGGGGGNMEGGRENENENKNENGNGNGKEEKKHQEKENENEEKKERGQGGKENKMDKNQGTARKKEEKIEITITAKAIAETKTMVGLG
eukprot:CAMPEP_0175060550 /NCGR_PEP_ID=MMETSP0052_2-20121109/13081_1 /TAXON_ID=51329 ORGANISM="Polytomella parva, Strain SAG 63-3" /NCGR_SAMPLE_ID=MMETSP0052_2 /ASSEMBLY_ACC=CAM_ASM_000194 /LENGTH=308 /DNA_ID=CAMNT_0016326285 /DNA_START=42 /DNA_END=968 /DNA_ORIENTATION=-